ncbi:MAG: Maf-like protein [Patulibacter sp.]|nr:Maf-like protein [Patulibacter sp.]
MAPPDSDSPSGRRASLVLASRSPQRQQILGTLGVDFTVDVAGIEEATDGDAIAVAVENARRKALAVAARAPTGSLVLGSDTVIAVPASGVAATDGSAALGSPDRSPWQELTAAGPSRAVGKPADAVAADAMLRSWSGRAHHVVSAAAVVTVGPDGAEVAFSGADATRVRFRALSDDDVAWYVATEEWRERAGGYAIQLRGSLLVDGIVGDWWNVVGLPVALLAREVPRLLR